MKRLSLVFVFAFAIAVAFAMPSAAAGPDSAPLKVFTVGVNGTVANTATPLTNAIQKELAKQGLIDGNSKIMLTVKTETLPANAPTRFLVKWKNSDETSIAYTIGFIVDTKQVLPLDEAAKTLVEDMRTRAKASTTRKTGGR